MKKRYILFILAVFIFSACKYAPLPVKQSNERMDSDVPLPITLSQNTHYYDALSDALQDHYDRICATLLQQSGNETTDESGEPALMITLDPPLDTMEDIERLCAAVYNDHPEFFYLTSRSSCTRVNNRYTAVTLYYSMTLDKRRTATTQLNAVVDSLIAACESKSDVGKELYLHDSLIEHCRYNTEAAAAKGDSALHIENSSPYYALCEGRAVCGGYTRAMQLLLDRAGIRSTPVYGDNHVWNMVWINGSAYHLDATWDDANDGFPTHHYFNLTSEEIARSRAVAEQTFALPKATSHQANYYVIKKYVFDGDTTESRFAEMILQQILGGSDCVTIRFTEDRFEDAVRYIGSAAFFEVFDGLKRYENGEELYRKWCTFSYSTAPEICAVTFYAG